MEIFSISLFIETDTQISSLYGDNCHNYRSCDADFVICG